MRSLPLALALGLQTLACAAAPTLTERPEAYHLYRAARVAPTLEERLRAADRYLREVPGGPHTKQLRTWFMGAEEKYFLRAFDRLPNLYAYREALPHGPHIEEVQSRIDALEARKTRLARRESEEDTRIAATQARLQGADADRRAFVATFKEWTARLLRIQSFGEPTSELADETIFAFRLTDPRGACRGDECRKLLQLQYEVPGERELVPREALLEVQLELERGLLKRARLSGPELWTRLAEALSLRPLPSATPEERADALNRASMLVRALLEPSLPASECEKVADPPAVLVRQCRGLSARMIAGASATDDDTLEIAPAKP
ncbi:MAG: hypothetical protein EOO73_26195 [Myxococcales bacterium]|nr:MAG: hypothetical protein EOO73_26195 [Myxococcales bacterium]